MSVLDVVILIISILAFIASIFGARFAIRKIRSRSKRSSFVDPVRKWHVRMFEEPLKYLDEHVKLLKIVSEQTSEEDKIKKEDLLNWGTDLLLTAASMISPFSQGKANLFVVSSVSENGLMNDIRSQAFVGSFPLKQLMDSQDMTYRDMLVPGANAHLANFAVAAQSLFMNSIVVQPIEEAKYASAIEKDLGTTHILAIPLRSNKNKVKQGDLAVITVDFRFPKPWYRRPSRPGPSCKHEKDIKERAEIVRNKACKLFELP